MPRIFSPMSWNTEVQMSPVQSARQHEAIRRHLNESYDSLHFSHLYIPLFMSVTFFMHFSPGHAMYSIFSLRTRTTVTLLA